MSIQDDNEKNSGSNKWGNLDAIPTPKSNAAATSNPVPDSAPSVTPPAGNAAGAANQWGNLDAIPTPAATGPGDASPAGYDSAAVRSAAVARDDEDLPKSKPNFGVIIMLIGVIGLLGIGARMGMEALGVFTGKVAANLEKQSKASTFVTYEMPTQMETQRVRAVLEGRGISCIEGKKPTTLLVSGAVDEQAKTLIPQLQADGKVTAEQTQKVLVTASTPAQFQMYSNAAGPMAFVFALPEVQSKAKSLSWITELREQEGTLTKPNGQDKVTMHLYHLKLSDAVPAPKQTHQWIIEVDGEQGPVKTLLSTDVK